MGYPGDIRQSYTKPVNREQTTWKMVVATIQM